MSLYQTQDWVRELKYFFNPQLSVLCMYQMENKSWMARSGSLERTIFKNWCSTYCNLLLCCCIDRLAIAVTVSVSSFSFCRASIAEQTAVCAVRLMHGQCGSFEQSNHRYSEHAHAHYKLSPTYVQACLLFSALYVPVRHKLSSFMLFISFPGCRKVKKSAHLLTMTGC